MKNTFETPGSSNQDVQVMDNGRDVQDNKENEQMNINLETISILERETMLLKQLEELEEQENVLDKLVADKEATMSEYELKLEQAVQKAREAEENRLAKVQVLEEQLSKLSSSITTKQSMVEQKTDVISEYKKQIEAIEITLDPEKAKEIATKKLEAEAKAERTELIADAEVELNGLRLDIEELIAGLSMYKANKDLAKEGDLDHFISEFKSYGQEVHEVIEDVLDVPPSDNKREYKEIVRRTADEQYPELAGTVSGLFKAIGKCFAMIKSEEEEQLGVKKGHRPKSKTFKETTGQLGQKLKAALAA